MIHQLRSNGIRVVDSDVANLMMIMSGKEEMFKQLASKTQQLFSIATELNQVVQEIVASIQELSDSAENLATEGKSQGEAADAARDYIASTGEVLSFIKKVATETKLLGLNDYGRGFAVVAEESARSAEQIGSILSN